MSFFLCPLIAQSNGRFKTAHMDYYYSARAKPGVRQFETALCGALSRGQSKKDISMLFRAFLSYIIQKKSDGVMR